MPMSVDRESYSSLLFNIFFYHFTFLGFPFILVLYQCNFREQIVTSVNSEQVLIIAGDTGCGKSTQVPQYLLRAGYKRIGKLYF